MTNEEMLFKVKAFIDKKPNENGNLVMEGDEMQAIAQMLWRTFEVVTETAVRDLNRSLHYLDTGYPAPYIPPCGCEVDDSL